MQTGPVDFEIFMTVVCSLTFAGVGAFGWVARRADKLSNKIDVLEARLAASDKRNSDRHDNGLADVWQALEAHRKESRDAAAEAARNASQFRERTLIELGNIQTAIARLSPAPLVPQPEV